MIICLIVAIVDPSLSIGLAIGKEYGDHCNPNNKWDWLDIVADLIGWVIGTVIHYLIKIFMI